MDNQNQNNTQAAKKPLNKTLVAVLAVVVVIAALLVLYFTTRPVPVAGQKTITVAVVGTNADTETEITTVEEHLRGALEQVELIAGEESDYGLFVTTVNGVTADDAKQEWWCFTKGGEMLETGVDTTPIADGDHFEITLTEGY